MKIFMEPPSDSSRRPIDEIYLDNSDVFLVDYKNKQLTSNLYWADISGTLVPEEGGDYEFSVSVCGTAKLFVDDLLVVDNETRQVAGRPPLSTARVSLLTNLRR